MQVTTWPSLSLPLSTKQSNDLYYFSKWWAVWDGKLFIKGFVLVELLCLLLSPGTYLKVSLPWLTLYLCCLLNSNRVLGAFRHNVYSFCDRDDWFSAPQLVWEERLWQVLTVNSSLYILKGWSTKSESPRSSLSKARIRLKETSVLSFRELSNPTNLKLSLNY